MSVWRVGLLLISVQSAYAELSQDYVATPHLKHVGQLKNVAKLGDAKHRGPRWYDYDSGSSSDSDQDSKYTESSSSISSVTSSDSSDSVEASSLDTTERKKEKQSYRHCTKCPHDMLKKHKNIGIKWICGGYQRARRSFKSICMMRFRNCQDGTMFVKLYDHRCKNSSHHGRHWFYQYKV